ncbi:MAG: allantoicase [Gemmatimonadetes bacterium]|nr:allantoicase [Gemmatimonadota bacterium]
MPDFTDLIDLASERLGASVLWANDEFFAPKEALLKPSPAEWREGAYTERGKWMDGWETRRRREPGHDWCLVRLGAPGVVHGVVIDTAFFRGNYPDEAQVEGCDVAGVPDPVLLDTDARIRWVTLVPRAPLAGDAKNAFPVSHPGRVTHLRLRIYPDGGVARLRVHGQVTLDPALERAVRELDFAAMENGGFVEVCSDMFFGHRQNLILPGRSTHMGDGWETKRRRGPGNDWTIVRLGARATLGRVELDTDHFRGNAPGSVMLEWCDLPRATPEQLVASTAWRELVPATRVQPHARHQWGAPAGATATHVRLSIYPDGGVARLRLFGTAA